MKPKKRQKLCYHCEGEIDLDVIVCPFCAADLRTEKPESIRSVYQGLGGETRGNRNYQTSESLYPPSFSARTELPPKEDLASEQVLEKVPEEAPPSKLSKVICPTILFTLGIQLFVLGMFILLFSHKGVVVLKWDGTFWFFYVLSACPLLYFGYRGLSKIDE